MTTTKQLTVETLIVTRRRYFSIISSHTNTFVEIFMAKLTQKNKISMKIQHQLLLIYCIAHDNFISSIREGMKNIFNPHHSNDRRESVLCVRWKKKHFNVSEGKTRIRFSLLNKKPVPT